MRQLILVRHAKSSWKELKLNDFDRPLNRRGKENLKMMSKLISERYSAPDLILSSPAERAKATAIGFAEKLKYEKDKIIFLDDLYMANEEEIAEIISKQNDDVDSIAVFGHNPGLTDFVNLFSDSYIDNIPTCGIVHLKMKNNWKEIEHKIFSIVEFIYPKMFGEFED